MKKKVLHGKNEEAEIKTINNLLSLFNINNIMNLRTGTRCITTKKMKNEMNCHGRDVIQKLQSQN